MSVKRIFSRNKKRDNEDEHSNPHVKITKVEDPDMDVDYSSRHASLTPSPSSPSPSPSYYIDFPFNSNYNLQDTITSQENTEVSNGLKKMSIDNILDRSVNSRNNNNLSVGNVIDASTKLYRGTCSLAQGFETFAPLVGAFFKLGEEMIILYDKAKHNKELCGFLLNRCNCAMAAVRDLDIRKTENLEFFSKRENFDLFVKFIECMKKMKKFISRVSKLHKLAKYFLAASIEDDFNDLVTEFDGYMRSLNFSFILQSRNEVSKLSKMRHEIRQIKEVLFDVYGIPKDKESCQDYLNKMDSLTEKTIKFKTETITNADEITEDEPLLDGKKYQRTFIHSKRTEKRTSFKSCEEFCFREFSISSDQSQIEIRKQVNILKELKNSDHIIRFYGVALEDTKYYLVTEWMEYGNLHEYYKKYGDSINLEAKIKFALDICRGVAYLHECKILHHDIQSANILINGHHKARIANFGLSKKFSDITRNITHNLENIRYMAPEKLLLDNDEINNNDAKKKKVPYDSKCEIYSVGALLWEIAELKKPHSDLNKADMLVSIRQRVSERYALPFSKDIPCEWEFIVSRAMEFEPAWRHNISDICHSFYKMSKKYSSNLSNSSNSRSQDSYNEVEYPEDDEVLSVDDNQSVGSAYITIKILSVDDAIREHKSKNCNKQLAWQSFKHHSSTNIEAKYWLGYYYYHDKEIQEIPELQQIDKKERIKIAVEIFKETADKGNPSAQLRYGICLWQGEGIKANPSEALKYLKLSANQNNSAAMYIIGKAYWNGGDGIEQDKNQGAEYLKSAAKSNHPKAREMCITNKIPF